MSTPTIHRITPDNPPQFPCWVWHAPTRYWDEVFPEDSHLLSPTQDTHWCHSNTRPTEAPDVGHEADFVTKSDTPRTDEALAKLNAKIRATQDWTFAEVGAWDHARTLERELAAAHARAEAAEAKIAAARAEISSRCVLCFEEDYLRRAQAAERQLAEQTAATEQATRLYDATWQNATKWARENTELKQQVATLRKALQDARRWLARRAAAPKVQERIEQALAATAPEEKP